MDVLFWTAIVVAGLVSFLAVWYVVWPLLQPGPALPLVDDDRLVDLLARKDVLLRSIKELEFDHAMGKIADEDYTRFSARLRSQAMSVLRQIDMHTPAAEALDSRLEAEIAALRKVQSAPERAAVEARGKEAGAQAGEPAAGPILRYCTQCGKPVALNHKFCAECGAPIAAPAQEHSV